MNLGLKDKVALVTGVGSQIGFGKGIVLVLAREGCDTVAVDKDLKGAKQTAADVKALGRKAVALKADISKKAEVDDMVKAALTEFGRIDILVNNAGVGSPDVPFVNSLEADWDKEINVNYKGTLYCTYAILPQMLERKSGKIINISSLAGIMGAANNCTYTASKAAILIFSKALSLGVKDSGINVNVVTPGIGDTGLLIASKTSQEFVKHIKQMAVEGKTTMPEDVGNVVAFLASDRARNISGQVISA